MLTNFIPKASCLIQIWRSITRVWLAMASFQRISIHWLSWSTSGNNLSCLVLVGIEMSLQSGLYSYMMIQFASILHKIWITSAQLPLNGRRNNSTAKLNLKNTTYQEITRISSRSLIAMNDIQLTGQLSEAKMRRKLELSDYSLVNQSFTIFFPLQCSRNLISFHSSQFLKAMLIRLRISQWYGAIIKTQISANNNGPTL